MTGLSWIVTSGQRGVQETAYRINMATRLRNCKMAIQTAGVHENLLSQKRKSPILRKRVISMYFSSD